MEKKTITLNKPTWKRLSQLKLDTDIDTIDDMVCALMDVFEKQSADLSTV